MLHGLSLSNRHKRGLEFELNLVHSTRVAILIATDWLTDRILVDLFENQIRPDGHCKIRIQ